MNILIIDDDELFGQALTEEFQDAGYIPSYFSAPTQSELELHQEHFSYALVDLRLKNQTGLELIDLIKNHSPNCFIVIMTGFGTIATAVEAIKRGASDYLTKPVTLKKFKELVHKNAGDNKPDSSDYSPLDETPMSLDRVEREYIEHILIQEKGNISKTAEKLGLHRQSLQRKLKKWVPFK